MVTSSLPSGASVSDTSNCRAVGGVIRTARTSLGLTIRDLAGLSGVSRYRIGLIERGQAAYPLPGELSALTGTLGRCWAARLTPVQAGDAARDLLGLGVLSGAEA